MALGRGARRALWGLAGLVLAAALAGGWRFASMLARWRHLDTTYEEAFKPPAQLAADLAGRKVLFHVKTGLEQDDSQICVGFNIVWAALEAGADVTVLFDAGALLDLAGESSPLHGTRVPLRLRKVIAAQMNRPLDEVPGDYGRYLDLLHDEGARIYANTAMLVVTGDGEKVQRSLSAFSYIEPAPYATVAGLLASADTVIAY